MFHIRHQLVIGLAALGILAFIGYPIFTSEPNVSALASTSGRLTIAKERLQQGLEEQNRGLKHALEAARASLKQADRPAEPTHTPASKEKTAPSTDGFAYVFYATNDNYACSVLVNIDRLTHRLNTTLPIHVIASESVSAPFTRAIQAAGAHLHIQTPPPLPKSASPYYASSLLKLRAFEMHQLSPGLTRVLALDADQLLMRDLDDLFTALPPVDLAAPRAYWLDNWLASTFLLISLSDRLWTTMQAAMQANLLNTQAGGARYDMDVVNDVLGKEALVLGGEYVCLNSHWEEWTLPGWYHEGRELNWTTIGRVNELSKPVEAAPGWEEWSRRKRKRQLFTHTDLPVIETPPPPVVVPRPVPAPQQQQLPPHSATIIIPPAIPTTAPAAQAPLLPTPAAAANPPPPSNPSPSPRFPLTHPLTLELHDLHAQSCALVHFTAVGKPWDSPPDLVELAPPDAHPALAGHFGVWWEAAERVCPGGGAAKGGKEVESLGVGKGVGGGGGGGGMEEAAGSPYVTPLSGVGVPVAVAVHTTW